MFTGLVQALGEVVRVESGSAGTKLTVRTPWDDLVPGESVAVHGCCLTALPAEAGLLVADLSNETCRRTRLDAMPAGERVHLERALRVGDRLGGHVVLGHVDGMADVVSLEPSGAGARLAVSVPHDASGLVVPKGSVAIDGVSLTVAALSDRAMEVALVPETLRRTTLGSLRAGDRVHVEWDVAAKHGIRSQAMPVTRAFTGAPWESLVGYCRGVRAGSVISVSGCAPVADGGGVHAPGDARAQAQRCLAIGMAAVRELAAGEPFVVMRTRMFVTDISQWAEFGRAHAEVFGVAPPATTMVEVRALIDPAMLIEIEMDAVAGAGVSHGDGLESQA